MESFLKFLDANATGVWLFLACLGAAILAIQWLMWIFGAGRFAQRPDMPLPVRGQALRYLITEALTKIINDFRHLLALIVVLIFGLALAYALYEGGGDMEKIKEALQAVTATLGGLVGSIIGYYFGESKAANDATPGAGLSQPQAVQGNASPPGTPPITAVTRPTPPDA